MFNSPYVVTINIRRNQTIGSYDSRDTGNDVSQLILFVRRLTELLANGLTMHRLFEKLTAAG